MIRHKKAPDDILEFIRTCASKHRLYWTYHVNMRLAERSITRTMVVESTEHYELIKAYPDDRFLPSYLVYSRHEGVTIHILFAADFGERTVRVITAYKPDPHLWDSDLKRRKRS